MQADRAGCLIEGGSDGVDICIGGNGGILMEDVPEASVTCDVDATVVMDRACVEGVILYDGLEEVFDIESIAASTKVAHYDAVVEKRFSFESGSVGGVVKLEPFITIFVLEIADGSSTRVETVAAVY